MCTAPLVATAQQENAQILRLDTGVHTADVHGVAVSPDGKIIATASSDQTVRLWSVPDLTLVRTIRMPVGPDRQGAVSSVAFTPDGRTLATTGRTGSWHDIDVGPWCIYLLDIASADITRMICDLPAVANRLAYSRDGAYFAVAFKWRKGLRIYRTSDYTLLKEDSDYGDDSTWVEFDAAGRVVTASVDGYLRLYDSQFRLIHKRTMPEGRRPLAASFSPDGSQIAVGYADPLGGDPRWPAAIDVVSSADLAPLFRPDVRTVDNGAFWRIAWSADGRWLYATGNWRRGNNRFPIRRWADGGRGRPQDIVTSPDVILDMRQISGGGIAFAGGILSAGVIDAADRVVMQQMPAANYTDIANQLAVSADGATVQFAFEVSGNKPATFSFQRRSLEPGEAPANAGLTHPTIDNPNIDVRDWDGSYRPTLNGAPLILRRPNDKALSIAFAPDGKSFLLGTAWYIYHYDADGAWRWPPIPVLGNVRGLVVTPDGRLVVAALSDGTLRWYAMDTGKELLALFPHSDQQRWVAWTPSGYYMASVEGDALIGWQVNRGRDHAADFFPVSVFRDIYYRPDIVTKTLATLNEKTAIQYADEESGRPPRDRALASLLPPIVSILSPESGTAVASPRVSVQYELRAASGESIKIVEVRANGRPLAVIERGPDAPLPERGGIEVYVPRRDIVLEVVAQTDSGIWSTPGTVRLRWTGSKTEEDPALFVLAIGVSRYKSEGLSLRYADKDADDFVKLLRAQEGRRYRKVNVEPLQNEDAQIPRIRQALRWLETHTTSRDVAMVFIAGHGTDDPAGQYFFLPYEASAADVFERGLSYGELRAALARIPGKVFLFIDTCRSGAVGNALAHADMARIANDLRNSEYGVVVFASSAGAQDSMESAEWQNGAFTKALIAGLSGKAPQSDGYVTALGLSYFVSVEVLRMTSERQRPVFGQPVSADFNLVKVAK